MSIGNAIPLADAYRILNPGCVVVVSVGDGQRDNALAITWNMPARRNPPRAAILCGQGHYSYPFIAETQSLVINVLGARWVDAVYRLGAVSGRDVADKFAFAGLHRTPAREVAAPMVAEAMASLECRVAESLLWDGSALLVLDVVRAWADPTCFANGEWRFGSGDALLHHLTGRRFCLSERTLLAQPITKD